MTSKKAKSSGRDPKRKSAAYHHGDLRRALLDATLTLIEADGPEGFTLRAAAKAAGVSDAAPYHHFSDKDGLLAAVAEEGFVKLYDEMRTAAEATTSAKDAARAMGAAYVVFAATHPAHFRVMAGRRARQKAEHPELFEAASRAFEIVRDSLMSSLADEEVELPMEQVVFGSWALVHGLAFLAIDGHLGAIGQDPERVRSLVHGVMDVLSGPRDQKP